MTIRQSLPAPLARRRVLRACALAAAGAFVATPARASRPASAPEAPRLAFINTHTDERLDVVFREGDRYVDEATAAIDWLLRDHRANEAMPIDRELLEALARLRLALGTVQPFHVISGYRSPATNAMLARASGGVARRSLHLQARAIDIRVPGVALGDLRGAAIALGAGGVGAYRRSDFVHLDTGRVRAW